ncbi:hypothetical protein CYMTET_3212 [Cymbomonas tetramitiformis]|uniref:Uncharacterized protein n=1 Tax=Cymbomonas tetramitiformis TaxID=36881 RepID=A0AAE0LL28_9CHLO|nr:hypothetical protein CYMTET_3212 [Cymbomonas tetramitiformis]
MYLLLNAIGYDVGGEGFVENQENGSFVDGVSALCHFKHWSLKPKPALLGRCLKHDVLFQHKQRVQYAQKFAFEPKATHHTLEQIITWVQRKVQQIWKPTICGDGVCTAPFEFPSYGRFGCKVDCGHEMYLASRTAVLQATIPEELAPSATQLLARWARREETVSARILGARGQRVAWNFCLKDTSRSAAGMDDLCWFAKDQQFNLNQRLEVMTTIDVPEGSTWFVRLRGDHYGLVSGMAPPSPHAASFATLLRPLLPPPS